MNLKEASKMYDIPIRKLREMCKNDEIQAWKRRKWSIADLSFIVNSSKNGILAYKAFDKDADTGKLSCLGFLYEIGKSYHHKGPIRICRFGFHSCLRINDCFDYYPSSSAVCLVLAFGDINVSEENNKIVSSKIKIIRELPKGEINYLANFGHENIGTKNIGNKNIGMSNIGSRNVGAYNSGSQNKGDFNVGNNNIGDTNIGSCNVGERNNGHSNLGNDNFGSVNYGNENIGMFNSTSNVCGFFNTICISECPFQCFNKSAKGCCQKFFNYDFIRCLLPWFFREPENRFDGISDFHKLWEIAWKNIGSWIKVSIYNMPNFDPKIFREITGIDVEIDKDYQLFLRGKNADDY